jgi:hypothetical protein
MVESYTDSKSIKERRRERADRLNPVDPEENFRQWKGIVGLPPDFPRLSSLDWDALHPQRGLYLNQDQVEQLDQIFQNALSPKVHPNSMVLVQPGQGTTTFASYTYKQMTDHLPGYGNISPARSVDVLPVGVDVRDYTKRGLSLEQEVQEGIMMMSEGYGISGIAGLPIVDTLAVVQDKGITPQIVVDLSGFDGNISEVVGEMKDIEEKAGRALSSGSTAFGQMYFGSFEQYGAMQSVYGRHIEEIRVSPFTPMEAFVILLQHYPAFGMRSRRMTYTNPAAVVSSKVMDRAYATLAAEGKSWSTVRLDEAVAQFEVELLNNMDRRWSDITYHQQ